MRLCSGCKLEKDEAEFYTYQLVRHHPRCRDCFGKYSAKSYKIHKIESTCVDCHEKTEAGLVRCENCQTIKSKNYSDNIKSRKEYGKQYRYKLKIAAFNAYGGPICKCCGETTMEFLSIDHINNDGAAHRNAIRQGNNWISSSKGIHLASWLKKNGYPSGFQVLCMNCNFAKGHFGKCPHQKEA